MTVESFTGSSCSTSCPVLATQSTIRRRSPKSPTPKLPSERSEKTGTTVPAARHGAKGKRASASSQTTASPLSMWGKRNVRLAPSSQRSPAALSPPTATNLYSNSPEANCEVSSAAIHSPGCCSVMATAWPETHEPTALSPPSNASRWPERNCGARTLSTTVRSPPVCAFALAALRAATHRV